MPKHQSRFSITLRVLGYRDGKGWAAHCLETDLVGHGRNFQTALSDLVELTEMQVSFALQTEQPSLLDHPAPPDIWQTYERLAQESLRNLSKPRQSPTNAIGSLPLHPKAQSARMAWCGA